MTDFNDLPAKDSAAPVATILVVDDQPENLQLLSEILRSRYRVRLARSGADALRAVKSDPIPDLVLLDIMMPGMDGFEVLDRLRNDPGSRAIPVIFVTALDSDEDEARGLDRGAADYITKPVRPAIVLARVQTQLVLKSTRDELENMLRENSWLVTKLTQQKRELEEALRAIRGGPRR